MSLLKFKVTKNTLVYIWAILVFIFSLVSYVSNLDSPASLNKWEAYVAIGIFLFFVGYALIYSIDFIILLLKKILNPSKSSETTTRSINNYKKLILLILGGVALYWIIFGIALLTGMAN